MSYIGDFAEDYATLEFCFTSRQFSTGAPFTLAGTPSLAVYVQGSLTQTTAGVTLTVDYDGVTGLNHVLIDLSADAVYATGKDYDVVIAAGTVDSVSVVGEVVGKFSIENRFADLPAAAQASINAIEAGGPAQKYNGPRGPGIYYDDGAANTNTTFGTDGTVGNPVSTLAAAITLVGSLGAQRIYIKGASTLTLTGQTIDSYEIIGLNGPDSNIVNLGTAASPSVVTNFEIFNCKVYGTHDLSGRVTVAGCHIDDAPAAEVTTMHLLAIDCVQVGDMTLDTSEDNVFINCRSGIAGSGYPTYNFTGNAGTVQWRGHDGGIGIASINANHAVSIGGVGQVVYESDCNVNAQVALRGSWSETDNTAGMANITRLASYSIENVFTGGQALGTTGAAVDTVTNLTNAPTNGDFTATMKASITAAVPAASAISTQVASDLAAAHGAGSWATATGFSTHTAADVWTSGTRTLTSFSFKTVLGDNVTHGGPNAIFEASSFTGNLTGNISGSIGSLGAQAKLDVNAEVDTAFGDNMPTDFATQWPLVYQTEVSGITTSVEAAAGKHSVAGAVMMQTNGAVSGGVWTAKKPSDDTTFQTYTVTTDAAADNITGVS